MDAISREKLLELVIHELTNYGARQKGKDLVILCPFHEERTPSLGVSIDPSMPGVFNCWSCPAHGSWNDIARKLGLELFEYAESGVFSAGDDPFNILSKAIKRENVMEGPKCLLGIEPLPHNFKWRGLGASFYRQFGAGFYWDKDRDIEYLYFPITMHNHYCGYTLCKIHREPGDKLKYLTFADTKKTLFLYDSLPEGEPVVLVEGIFDALKLTAEGIYCLGIFGTENWGPVKKSFLMGKMPRKVMVCFDGDRAGWSAAERVFLDLRDSFDTDIFYLPIADRKEDKIDPGNMSPSFLSDLRARLG